MFSWIGEVKDWLAGKKTYLVGVAALIGVVVAWSTGEFTDFQALEAAFVAVQTIFLRAGIAKV